MKGSGLSFRRAMDVSWKKDGEPRATAAVGEESMDMRWLAVMGTMALAFAAAAADSGAGLTLRRGGTLWASIEEDGGIRIGGTLAGRWEDDGYVRRDGSLVGRIEDDGAIRVGGTLAGKIEADGTFRRDGRIIGLIQDDGTIRRGGSIWGSVEEGCPDHPAKKKAVAVLVFFAGGFFD